MRCQPARRNRTALTWAAVALLISPIGGGLLGAEQAEPVATMAATSDYRTAWLLLEQGGVTFQGKSQDPLDVPLFLGLRDGKVTVAWFAHPAMSGGRIVWLDRSSLTLDGDLFRGDLVGRTNLNWGDKNVHDYVYKFDAMATGGKIEGRFTAEYVDDAGQQFELDGKLTGQLFTAQQWAEANKLAAGKNWPHFYGDGYRLTGPACRTRLIDDLARVRPVWKSEAYIPTAYGSAPDSRYFDRAGRTGSGGGASSPVVVDGRVYQFYYYPRGPVGRDKPYAKYETEAELAAIAKELFPKREIQQRAVLDHFRMQADEVLVCLDAATGQTLWKTTFPQRVNNYQTHKHRGHFPVPLVAGGVVYQPGTTGRLYALDAATGEMKWEFPDAEPEPYTSTQGGIDSHAPSPVLVQDVVAFAAGNRVLGVDAATGAKKWEQPLWHRTSLLAARGDDWTLIIASDRNHETKQNFAVAIHPADGSVAWRQKVDYLIDFSFPLLADDLLVGYSLHKENVKPGKTTGWPSSMPTGFHRPDCNRRGRPSHWHRSWTLSA